MLKVTIFLLALALILLFGSKVEAAKRCYSGQNARYAEKQCSTGSMSQDFTCQKFVCEGGKSPFTLRTCGQRNMGCLAGPRICQFSGGKGSSQFVTRSCGAKNKRACGEEEKMCLQFLGISRCITCETDLCNGEPQTQSNPLELQESHLVNNNLFNFTSSKPSQFNIDRIPSAIDVNSKQNGHDIRNPSVFVTFSTLLVARGLFCWRVF